MQAASDQITTLVTTCAAVIQKEEKAAQAALTKAGSEHETKIRQHEQRMQDAHAAYQAAVAAEWAELQQSISSHAKALQVCSARFPSSVSSLSMAAFAPPDMLQPKKAAGSSADVYLGNKRQARQNEAEMTQA